MTGLIDRGYATLVTDPDDARRRHVHLTAEGDAYAEAIIRSLKQLNRDIESKVAKDDLQVAIEVLRFVRDNIGR